MPTRTRKTPGPRLVSNPADAARAGDQHGPSPAAPRMPEDLWPLLFEIDEFGSRVEVSYDECSAIRSTFYQLAEEIGDDVPFSVVRFTFTRLLDLMERRFGDLRETRQDIAKFVETHYGPGEPAWRGPSRKTDDGRAVAG